MLNSIKGFHIEPTNICTLKCPGCPRTQFIETFGKYWKNVNLNVADLDRFLDIDLQGMRIDICGNYGDPIYFKDLLSLIKMFKSRGANILLTTNGSHKTRHWWETIVEAFDHNDTIIFSIDGIPENFTQYRINGDWESIQTAIEVSVASHAKTQWKYIPFSFNENNINQAKELSENLGIDTFRVFQSDRFDDSTRYLTPTQDQINFRYDEQEKFKNQHRNISVTARCYNHHEHYISADGFYSPCCFSADHRFYYKQMFGKRRKELFDIRKTTITEILSNASVVEFYRTIETTRPDFCQFNCPSQYKST